ncbi:ribonuclease R [Segnochrobactrum spirostomi]|uniref:Ribonuclease R n=1 Tax=Segnochrobactrum spirostomi TaxID=2608987 RepID=A0A6A7XXT6_9HYPH|nr:ribonuclease R [Segnochrobactrum spirostomi]MQT11245.1 ribonuclease R [Segnochrobactrum spirostomi]
MAPTHHGDREDGVLPSRKEILAYLAEHPGEAGKRELARAFGIRGAGRIALKRLLKELEAEGIVERRRKRLIKPGDLPPVAVLAVVGRDADGELIGEPVAWDADKGPAPRIPIMAERHRARAVVGPAPGVGDKVLARLVDPPAGMEALRAGRVIKVIDRRADAVLGVVQISVEGRGARILPVDKKRARELEIEPDGLEGAEDGDLVSVSVTRVGRYGLPKARVVERIGSMKSERAVSMIAIHTHGIPNVFPAAALAEAEEAKPATLKDREDWRTLPLVTIDPPDAKDHDDAVHAEPDPDPDNKGGFLVTVAIADVAHYVRPRSALDKEALKRGNSVYFPDHVVPMLPERISNDLCSLKEAVDRPALAVRMVFGHDGRKRSHTFHRIMMRSAARLAYAEAQAAIDGRPSERTEILLDPILRPLWDAYACLKRGRDAREPLDLDLPERKIILDRNGMVDRVYVPERLDAHKLIEEFMIQANVAAAETLEKRKTGLLYRIHDAPSLEKLEALREFLSTLDIKLVKAGNLRPSQFNQILARVVGTPNAHLVNEVVLRSQSQAEYSPANIGHFGLNLRRYAHFTSPIRRYADLVVHRGLIRTLGYGPDGLTEEQEAKLEPIGADISAAERRAMAAERETVDRLIALWLADKVGARFHGRIGGVTKAGLFINLDETGADGFAPAATLGQDYYHYDEASRALIGRATGETFRLGDNVEVRLVEAAPFAGALRFEVLSDGSYLRGTRSSPDGRRPGRVPPAGRAKPRRTTKKGSR